MPKVYKLTLGLSIIPQFLLVKILAKYPSFVEENYSNLLYPFISKSLRYIFGWLPFSLGDLIYLFFFLFIIYFFLKNTILKNGKINYRNLFFNSLTALSLFYFIFHLFWGLNYYRVPLEKKLGLKTNYTTYELYKSTQHLIKRTNSIHFKLAGDDKKIVNIPYDFYSLKREIKNGYNISANKFGINDFNYESQKKSLFSKILAFMGFSGYLNPFTNEIQINSYIPINSTAITLAHERAHQLGYASEADANFIAFILTENHDNMYIQYSSYTFALAYCLNELQKKNKKKFEICYKKINEGVIRDYKNRKKNWNKFRNPIEPLFKYFYDKFLKNNNQKAGIESYSHVVGLIINSFGLKN
tara:strand:- start:18 stop:1088 length:1071 start_codon:yes stop_codon:yes gene_type:complete